MNIYDTQREAIRRNAADAAEFDLVFKGGRSRCRFEDADLGIVRILDHPERLKDKIFQIGTFGDEGFSVENFSVPTSAPRSSLRLSMDLEPEMPEGVIVQRGTELHRVKGISPLLECVWIPAAPESLLKLRGAIDRILFEDERRRNLQDDRAVGVSVANRCPVALNKGTALEAQCRHAVHDDSIAHDYEPFRDRNPFTDRIADVAKHSATVLFLLLALTTLHFAGSAARAQTIGTFERAVQLAGKINAAIHTRPRSELSKPCHVGDRIKVDGIWYDCRPRTIRVAKDCPPNCECFPTRNPYDASESANGIIRCSAGADLRTARDRMYRTRLNDAAAQPANFARHWVLNYWGCGTDCIMGAAVDKDTGRVAWLPFYVTLWTSPDIGSQTSDVSEPLQFSIRNGYLLIPRGNLEFTHKSEPAPQTWRLFRGKFIRSKK